MSHEHLRHTEQRVAQIEQMVDQIMRELRLEHGDAPALAAVRELIRSGDKVQAVKLYRAHTGVTLHEARRTVEVVAREMNT